MILTGPIGSSVYPSSRFIDPPALAPVARTNDPDGFTTDRESHRHYLSRNDAETIEPQLIAAMFRIRGDHALPIEECELGLRERHAMLAAVGLVLIRIPFEQRCHPGSVTMLWLINHT